MTSTDLRLLRPRAAFAGPGLQVNGLEAVTEGLWLCDQRDNRSYLVDYSGRVLTSFASPARNASGITFGAGSVWVSSNVDPAMIFRHDPASGQCTAFLMLEGAGGVHGLQWRPNITEEDLPNSGTLWVSRPGAQRIEHIDAETGELLGSFAFPMPRSHGLFWDPSNSTLQVVETNGGHVFSFEPSSGELVGEWRIEGPEVHGFTRGSDSRIWIGDASSNQVLVIDA